MEALREVIAILGGTAIVLGVAAWLARSLVKMWLDRQLKGFEIELKAKADRELEQLKAEIRAKADKELELQRHALQRDREAEARHAEAVRTRKERLRLEILRWANPILGAVRELRSRLGNILRNGADAALHRNPSKPVNTNWSIDYDYFLPSTLFLFGQYFYWVQRLKSELGFELFESHAEKDAFLGKLQAVSDALGSWPLAGVTSGSGTDKQLFALQQRALGELLIVRTDGGRCMGYDEFAGAWEESPLAEHLEPLRLLVDGLESDAHSLRRLRLQAVLAAVESLEAHCRSVLLASPPTSAAA